MIEQQLRKAARFLPGNLRAAAKSAYHRNRHWAHPGLKQYGTVQDLCYWVADGEFDTLLLLQNYFSALYPELDTRTEGAVSLLDKDGVFLGEQAFTLPHQGSAKITASNLREKLGVAQETAFGTLEVNIAIPMEVRAHIEGQKSFYFWDRFYLGYANQRGQVCFVHGVDKTHIYREGNPEPQFWYGSPRHHEWAPEIPVDIQDYKQLSVIVINRASQETEMTLMLSDTNDKFLTWDANIPSEGVHRFALDKENTAGLEPTELRIRIKGMATRFGRPVVFKEFPNGAFSAMHC